MLIIGAMKSGTTGLFVDLARHPDFYSSDEKEVNCLCKDDVLENAGLDSYASLYRLAPESSLLCDASTAYAKRPDNEHVTERATRVLGSDFQVIYIVRNPLQRVVSQYKHEAALGMIDMSVNEAVKAYPRLINYSRYHYQIMPWIDSIGLSRVRIVKFEDYVANREATVRELWDFLGLDSSLGMLKIGEVVNQSERKPVLNGFWSSVRSSKIYKIVRPLTTLDTRRKIRQLVLPKAKKISSELTSESKQFIVNELRDDLSKFREIPGYSHITWDLTSTR